MAVLLAIFAEFRAIGTFNRATIGILVSAVPFFSVAWTLLFPGIPASESCRPETQLVNATDEEAQGESHPAGDGLDPARHDSSMSRSFASMLRALSGDATSDRSSSI